MCGISGAFAFSPDAAPIDQAIVLRLNELQRRRGPDGTGLWSSKDNRVVLGHRRLAIIDTGSSGAQPMSDATGRWVISFNGEIYNYRAVRAELERLGCVFRTNSDTEVLINAVAQWGEAGLRKLRGMYAFALWDTLQPRALARARPLRYQAALCGGEPRDDLVCLAGARACNLRAGRHTARRRRADRLLSLGPRAGTVFLVGRRAHVAGRSCAAYPRGPRRIAAKAVSSTFKMRMLEQPAQPLAPGELRQLMLDSMRHHLVADVPVGIFLSAGIDSSVIAALAAELGAQLRTVTLAFDEYAGTPDDEAPLAEATRKTIAQRPRDGANRP